MPPLWSRPSTGASKVIFWTFWDAALWLFAFVFIELNVFEWQQEIRDDLKRTQPSV